MEVRETLTVGVEDVVDLLQGDVGTATGKLNLVRDRLQGNKAGRGGSRVRVLSDAQGGSIGTLELDLKAAVQLQVNVLASRLCRDL